MRLLPLLLLASCATAAPAANQLADDLAHLRGCWIERRSDEALTMRWKQGASSPGDMVGDFLRYPRNGEPEPNRFILRDGEGGFLWCDQDLGMPHGPPCQPAVVGAGPPPDPESMWVRVTASEEHLRVAIESGETSSPIFDGARDGCD
ncbi:MAG: hypothetical protein JNJ73_06965 [Hyphomonadaceae bacterium]|nr:hypothetical protein [Hyphomonadaceae bacterium]